MNRPIGVLGGTFDPIHLGHVRAAHELYEQLHLVEIRFVPCRDPVHKDDAAATARQRCDMIKLAIADIPYFILDTREVERSSPSYMVETLQSLQRDFPNKKLYLVIGMDSLLQLNQWYQWKKLFEYAHIIALPRPNYQGIPTSLDPFIQNKLCNTVNELETTASGKIYLAQTSLFDIASTNIRTLVKQGKSIASLCTQSVVDYIMKNKLYL